MRSRGQSPLLPYTNSQKLPSKRPERRSAATKVLVFTAVLVCVLYGVYSVFDTGNPAKSETSKSLGSSGRGLAAQEEVAQLQGKDAPVLDVKSNQEVLQLQTQGDGHQKAPETKGERVTADESARAVDSVGALHGSDLPGASGLYTMTAEDIDGSKVELSKFAGKVSLIVNVASECGYTESNYRGLQQLYQKYKDSGFEVLAFPCNSFGKQEPGSGQTIKDFAKQKYGVTFPLFAKVEVLGPDAHPVFKFLADNLPSSEGVKDLWQPKWNFSKWLVDKRGMPIKHYDSQFDEAQLERDIAAEILRAA